jgi:hypothetical protein
MSKLYSSIKTRIGNAAERGDVPGWVLITVMTAALVTALLAVARPQLTSILRTALRSVTG